MLARPLVVLVAEDTAAETSPRMRRELDRIHIGTFTGPAGTFRQASELSKAPRDMLAKLGIDPLRKVHQLSTPGNLTRLAPDPAAASRNGLPRDITLSSQLTAAIDALVSRE